MSLPKLPGKKPNKKSPQKKVEKTKAPVKQPAIKEAPIKSLPKPSPAAAPAGKAPIPKAVAVASPRAPHSTVVEDANKMSEAQREQDGKAFKGKIARIFPDKNSIAIWCDIEGMMHQGRQVHYGMSVVKELHERIRQLSVGATISGRYRPGLLVHLD